MKLQMKAGVMLLLCGTALMMSSATSQAGDVARVLCGSRQSSCHVIDLLMRYGTGSRETHAAIAGSPYGDSFVLAPKLGDLELVSVMRLAECTDEIGPTFGVTIRNCSERDVCHFSVSAVAVLNIIRPYSPSTTVRIDKLCAGETVQVQVQLPIESLAMGIVGGQPLEFKTLVVAIDSFDELIECNESNNILVCDRLKIAIVEKAVEEVTVPTPAPAAPAEAPDEAQPLPTNPKRPTTLDDIDIDKLDLDDDSN